LRVFGTRRFLGVQTYNIGDQVGSAPSLISQFAARHWPPRDETMAYRAQFVIDKLADTELSADGPWKQQADLLEQAADLVFETIRACLRTLPAGCQTRGLWLLHHLPQED
jgi:hypothetical protein